MAILGTLALKLIIPVLLLRLPRLPCFKFTKEPQSPIIVVLDHNTTNVNMEWKFEAEGSTIASWKIRRFLKNKDSSLSKETNLAYFSTSLKLWNQTLYIIDSNFATPGYANFTIKDVLKRADNADQTKVSSLSGDVYSYRLDVDTAPPSSMDLVTKKSSLLELQVYFPPTITALFCQGCQNGSAVENQTITLLCNATGKPMPNIRWMKNGEYYNGSSLVSSSNNALVFQQVAINNKGNYTCIADNGVGNPDRESTTLYVKYKSTNTLLFPTKLDVCENTDITLNCTADAYPSAKNYSLYNGNTYIGSSSSGQFTTTARLLRLNKFCCIASNEIGISQCAFSDVYILGDITTLCKINNENTPVAAVKEGDKVVLQCDVSGNESYYMYQWVKVKDSLSVRNDARQLTFGSINRTDEGYYQVTLRDKLNCSSQTRSFNITVNYPPDRITCNNKTVLEGDDVQLVCSANGNPPPDMMWIRNGSIRGMGSTLEINGVSKRDHGKYTFLANNSLGYQVENIFVAVKVKIIAPEIMNPYKEVILVDEGKDVSLVCNASGYPVPNITWTKHGTVIGVGRIFNITRVKRNDSSCYTCTADNGIGHTKNVSICLDVQYPPSSITIQPSRRQMILKEGTSLSLYCQSDSNPPPTYKWKHNGVTLTDRQNGILVFNSIKRKQNGTYQCEAKNYLGLLLSVPIEIVVQYLDPLEVTGSSNKSYSQSNPLVLFNLSINAYPSNTTLSCNPSAPNILTTITSHDAGLTRKQYLVVVIIQNDVDSASIMCKAENSIGVRESTLYFYRRPILFKETFSGQFRITNQEWQDDLQDVKSAGYNDLKQKCIKIFEAAYSGVPYLAAVNIEDFIKGSIIVRFELEVIGQVPDPLLPLRDYIKTQGEEINGLQIDYNSIQKSNDYKENTPIPCKGENKTLVAVLGALFGLSIVLIIILIVGFLWLSRKDSKGSSGKKSNTSDEMGKMNDVSLQETSFNATDNETPNVPEYEPIARRGLSTSNAGIPEYEAVSTRTQPSQPHSGVQTNIPMPQYESADQHRQTGTVSNPPPLTYQIIQPRTGNYDSLSPFTRLPHKSAVMSSTGNPTRTGEYQAIQHKGVSPQYQSLDDLSKC